MLYIRHEVIEEFTYRGLANMALEPYTQQHSGSLIEEMAGDLLLTTAPEDDLRPLGWLPDAQWVRQSFIVNTHDNGTPWLEEVDRINRSFSSADLKFTDTSLGGNTVINPPPQFTRYADPPAKGIIPDAADDVSLGPASRHIGMGSYYSEAIDDNGQVIHLRFGVAQYNSLTQFFTGFYSSSAGAAARTGRFTDGFVDSFLRTASKVLAMALVPLVIIPVAILMVGSAARFFMNWPTSKFYTLKPAMELYWNAVTSMVNQIGANQGIVTYMEPRQVQSIMQGRHRFNESELSIFSRMTDGAIGTNGAINVFKVANRAKRLEMNYETMRAKMLEDAPADANFYGVVKRSMEKAATSGPMPYSSQGASLESLLARYLDWGSKQSKIKDTDADTSKGIEGDPKKVNTDNGVANAQYTAPSDANENFMKYFLANLGDGSDWASFRVDYTGPVTESFTNSTAENSLAQKINGMTSSAHDVRMNFSGAAESIPGLSTVLDGVKTVLGTVASTLHLEGLAAVAGSSFVDIPKHWESSAAQLPRATYTMTLTSPYGNPISRMFSMYIPLAMLLAGALPLSTGKQSHTAPFLVELHDRGRVLSRLSIIDSLSITRGTSNLGFNNEGQPMAIDVAVSFLDLSSLMALPIQPGFSEQPFAGLFDGDNAFTDYLMALSGMSLKDSIYRIPMLKYQLKRTMANFSAFTSKASMANMIAAWPGVNALSGIMRGVNPPR